MDKPKALGAYIFAGGFTLGVREHFEVTDHLETEKPYGAATAIRNLGVKIHRLPDWPVQDFAGVPFIFGNPPCAAWSVAGAALGKVMADTWRTDPRVDCTRKHFTLLEELRPHVWVWESVSQAFTTGRELVDSLAERAMDMGYSVTCWLHNAKYLGVPHERKRFMFIAHNVEIELPPPVWEVETITKALTRINDIGDLHRSAAKYQESYGWLIADAVGSTDLRKVFNKVRGEDAPRNALGNVAGRPSFLLRRDAPDRVAATIMHERIHPTEDRFMTLKELMHLCGFPSWFEPNPKDMHELSRGVMPPVAEHVAACVAAALERNQPVNIPTYRLVNQLKEPGYEELLTLPIDGLPSPAGNPARRVVQPKPSGAAVARDAGADLDPARGDAAVPGTPRTAIGIPRPKPGVGRMAFLQVCIMMDRWTTQQLVDIVRHQWPVSKCSGADVSTQRRVLVERGYSPPVTRRKPAEDLPW